MKRITLIFTAVSALALAAEPTADQKLAAETARSNFYKLQTQIATLQSQATSLASDFNAKLEAMKNGCDSKLINPDTFACLPAPTPAPEEKKDKKSKEK